MPRNPPWHREELILALELYFRVTPSRMNSRHPAVIELSEILNKLPTVRDRPDKVRFRNSNGVYMKLCNFLRLDPSYHGKGLTRGGKLEEVIWSEFANDRERLKRIAQMIKSAV